MFNDIYRGKKVLITGHTGFKGSYLAAWLQMLGAEVCGIALAPETTPSHWELLSPDMRSEICDIRDRESISAIFASFQPEIVFHLAAQPLVRLSYGIPVETFEINCMGTVNILDICRHTPSVRAIVAITSDKCYENQETMHAYCESDPMGGYDPYSASKGCAELIINAYRRSFFHPEKYGTDHLVLLASARAGNVIGGGDWAKDRLVPDIMQAAANNRAAEIRNPGAVRPWQHVLEPLSGYLLLGRKLYQGDTAAAGAWNFGPDAGGIISVKEAAEMLSMYWEQIKFEYSPQVNTVHEANLLRLDCSKAEKELLWHGTLSAKEMFEFTALWYKEFYRNRQVITAEQLSEYITLAEKRNLAWTK
ncbi:MAG: CDP-glucose 4,6-dehydratase [Lentisphaeria bacterium]|nr:CDP-glucose 4,6-dehydratase [Lentisphaeria bacterium]